MDDDGWERQFNGLLVTPQEVQTAIHMCKLAASSIEEANDYLKDRRIHGLPAFRKIQMSKIGAQRFLVATTHSDPKTVYIAFNAADATENLFKRIDSYQSEDFPEGSFHRGLYEKTCSLPVDFLSLAEVSLAKTRVIFCGHSGGGSVAHLFLLMLLLGLDDAGTTTSSSERSNLVSIAFGSPLFVNAAIAKRANDHEFDNHLVTFVNRSDPVPLLFSQLPALKEKKLPTSLETDVAALTQGILSLLGIAAGMVATAYGLPVGPIPYSTLQSLWRKISNWLAVEGVSSSPGKHGPTHSKYVPAGVYVYLKKETPQNFSAAPVKPGSDDYGQTNASLEALGDHKLSSYMLSLDKTATFGLCPERLASHIPTVMYFATRVTAATLWPAQQQGAAYITVKGENLAGVLRDGCQVSSLSRDTLGEWVPRFGGGELRLVQADPARGLRIAASFSSHAEFQGLRIKLRTCYAEHEVEIEEKHGNGFYNSLKASLAGSLQNIALRRCFGSGGNVDEAESTLLGDLAAVIREEMGAGSDAQPTASIRETLSAAANARGAAGAALMEAAPRPCDALDEMVAVLAGLAVGDGGDAARSTQARAARLQTALEKLEAGKDQILEAIEAPLMIEIPKSRYIRAARAALTPLAAVGGLVAGAILMPFAMLSALFSPELEELGVAGRVGGFVFSPIVAPLGVAFGFGILAAGSSTRLVVIPTSDVLGFLQNFLSSESCVDPRKANARAVAELAQNWSFRSRSVADLGRLFQGADKSNKVPRGLLSIIRRIKAIALIVALEDLISGTCFVGVFGPENSGKSTFVKSWGRLVRARAGLPQMVDVPDIGLEQHTRLVSAYQVLDQLWMVDFPGNNGLDEYSKDVWRQFSSLSSLCVYMIDFSPGDLNSNHIEGIRQLRKNSARPVEVLVLVNKVDVPFLVSDAKYTPAFFQNRRARLALEFDCAPEHVLFTQLGGSAASQQIYEALGLRDLGVVRLEEVCMEMRNKLWAIRDDPERSSLDLQYL